MTIEQAAAATGWFAELVTSRVKKRSTRATECLSELRRLGVSVRFNNTTDDEPKPEQRRGDADAIDV
jgi:hypothetical protein